MTTSPTRRLALRAALLCTAALGASPWAAAQSTWPTKPVTIVVPFPAGGGTDAFARPLFAVMTKNVGKQFVIDNKGGAGGNVGATIAAKAAPDGYTFFMGAVHHAIAPSMYPKLDYNLEADFIPVGLISSVPQVIVVNPQRVPVTDLKGLLDYVRKNPGKLNYGSAGNGTSHHLAGELFKLQTQTFITHIPYRGAAPALTDLLGGQVDFLFDPGIALPHIRAGRLRLLAVGSPSRSPLFPDTPTLAEAGLKGFDADTVFGLYAPGGTPAAVVSRLNGEVNKILATAAMKERINAIGGVPTPMSAAEFGAKMADDGKRFGAIVRERQIAGD